MRGIVGRLLAAASLTTLVGIGVASPALSAGPVDGQRSTVASMEPADVGASGRTGEWFVYKSDCIARGWEYIRHNGASGFSCPWEGYTDPWGQYRFAYFLYVTYP